MNVSDVMTRDVVTATPRTTYKEAVDLLVAHGVSALPVLDDLGRVIGVVSEADLVPRVAFGSRARQVRAVADVMSTPVVSVRPGDSVADAARTLLGGRLKWAPVTDELGLLRGVVARRDLLGAYVRPDVAVQDEVVAALADPARAPEGNAVVAEVRDGVVTLRGAVANPDDRRVVAGVTWRVPGVVDLVDELTVTGPRVTV